MIVAHQIDLEEAISALTAMTEERDHYKRELGLAHDLDMAVRLQTGLHLTPRETDMLMTLYARRGRSVSTEALLDAMYAGRDEPESKIITVFACKLRKKLGTGAIATVWGRGFRLTEAGVALVEQAMTVTQ